MSEDTKTNREEKFVSLWEKRKLFYKTQIYDNQIMDEKLSSRSENTDSNATRITGSNAVS